jgi:F-type H+-transporting ATPase subunit c
MKSLKLLVLAVAAVALMADPIMAADEGLVRIGKGLGLGLILLGAGIGLGFIGKSMTESMARQPEIAPAIQTGAIIIAALLEGVTLLALLFTLF